jgi:hypothetical protein
MDPYIWSTVVRAGLLGYWENCPSQINGNDGCYGIIVAEEDAHSLIGRRSPCPFLSLQFLLRALYMQDLYNSIPAAGRPPIDLRGAGKMVRLLWQRPIITLGSVIIPIILKTADTNESVKLALHAFVVCAMNHRMFISWKALVALKLDWAVLEDNEKRKLWFHFENEHGAFNNILPFWFTFWRCENNFIEN